MQRTYSASWSMSEDVTTKSKNASSWARKGSLLHAEPQKIVVTSTLAISGPPR